MIYFIAIGDAYYTTLTVEQKTPPQFQTAQIAIIAELR